MGQVWLFENVDKLDYLVLNGIKDLKGGGKRHFANMGTVVQIWLVLENTVFSGLTTNIYGTEGGCQIFLQQSSSFVFMRW